MKFRPCIDIHNGKVKQIIGSSLKDAGDQAAENFVSQQDGAFYARLYRKYGLEGGHIILLNAASSEYYESTRQQALSALTAWPGHLQLGGSIWGDAWIPAMSMTEDMTSSAIWMEFWKSSTRSSVWTG